ncbi:beta-mannosidase [Teredinibacter waterburyi]|uniref:beta-mannosidase n=1 Tax=Teredinibacter waterburyi TaxID=1500538 RepID=UPI00165F698E|nr:glycoside hydrolase family 2 protein [Teredinibacter waterburyi]
MKILKEINAGWQFREATDVGAGEGTWLNATVPGYIHLDLMQHKIIDDPYWRDNETSQQWIGERDWEYQTNFTVSAEELAESNCDLVFEGLDTYADVYLNDTLVLSADNMYSGWQVAVADSLRVGDNQLRVYLHSVVKKTLPLYEENGFVFPANTSQPEPKLSVYSRKPGYHFGWDWGPRLVTSGIWRPVRLQLWRAARLGDVQFVQESLTTEIASLKLNVELEHRDSKALSLRLSDSDNSFQPVIVSLEPNVGTNAQVAFSILNPKLWWTRELGEQSLYDLRLELLDGNKVIDDWSHRIGLRTIEVIHDDDEYGKNFYFKLNGEPLFIKGSNCIPADFFVPRLTEADYRKMLGYATDANMNMLRLWGGAVYEEKIFYDLCDELGILVWQDFMFACAAYPCDDIMAKRIQWEAEYNIKRIRNHSCLALWCGNNEIAEGWHTWGWQKRYNYSEETCEKVWGYYERIFHEILPNAVAEFDSDKTYWASSPKYGFVDERAKVDGDMHYWGVWFLGHERERFDEYLPRFMSEYGLQSMPELKTFEAFSLPEDWDVTSTVMKTHQKQYANPSKNQFLDGYGMMLKYLEREYCIPTEFGQVAYMTQLLQADYLAYAIKAHRRNRHYCMGTMYWQLNDMWPVTSWASVDYFGRWKASHYAIRETYKPIIVVLSKGDDKVRLQLVSDCLKDVDCTLEFEVLGFDGSQHFQQTFSVVAKANQSSLVAEFDQSDLLHGLDSKQVVVVARSKPDNQQQTAVATGIIEDSQDLLYFHLNNALSFSSPNIQLSIDGNDLVVSSDVLVKNLFLPFDGCLTDNYFDLLPNRPTRIGLQAAVVEAASENSILGIKRRGEKANLWADADLTSVELIHYYLASQTTTEG